jgi:predicted ferric reductase
MPAWLHAYLNDEAQLMGLPLAGHTSAYWYMARAGGIVAYLLMWLSVVWGLLLSTKITARLIPPPLAYGLHEFVSIMAVIFAVLHSVVLLGDKYINFSVFDLVFPFTAPYEPIWTGLGTVGFYLIMAMTVSFYVRKQIGQRVWRKLHYLTFLTFGLVLAHGLMAGTDTPLPIIKVMYLGSGASVLFLTYYRLFTLKVK